VRQRKIWMILDHPHQLAIALPLASYWKHNFMVNLLISPHPYWREVRLDDYAGQFDQIVRFQKRPDYVSSLRGSVRLIPEILRIKEQIKHLGIKQDDVIIGLSHCTFIENIVLSCTPKNLRIAIIPESEYREALRRPDWSTFQFSRGGLFARYLIQPLTGLERTLRLTCRKQQSSRLGGEPDRFEREIADIYDKVVVLVNLYEEFGMRNSTTVLLPFPYVLTRLGEHNAIQSQRKKVVFFGSHLDGQPTSRKEFAKATNECLSFLRRTYGNTYELVYMPHPQETEVDWKQLDLSRFEIENDRRLGELYISDNRDSIDAVFSVHSTASRSAVNYGINAYVLFELFGFDDSSLQYHYGPYGHLGRQPDCFYIRDLTVAPVRYQNPERMDYARRVLQERLDSMVENGTQVPLRLGE